MKPKSFNKYVRRWKAVRRQIEKGIFLVVGSSSWSTAVTEPQNQHYKRLQKCYLAAFLLATFADWLQGPYLYKLYADYGYNDDTIAILYTTGFASSCLFGTMVGYLADLYGRKALCSVFTILYSFCCLTKTSSNYMILLIGRLFGGVSTSLLFTTFEAWYLNEHLNFFKMPHDWLNVTFTKATFYNGLSAIVAGVVSQFFVEHLQLGPMSPFILAIPFLLLSLLVIQTTWKEHTALTTVPTSPNPKAAPAVVSQPFYLKIIAPLKVLKEDEYLLLFLGLIQSLFESVMYFFVFSWTPVLAEMKPPLGIVFALFMVSLMVGSKLYSILIASRYQPQHLLTLSCGLATSSTMVVALALTTILVHVSRTGLSSTVHEDITVWSMQLICFLAFLLFEFAVGMYYPCIGYLRGRTVPEECRATLTNWFRLPMNLITFLTFLISPQRSTSDLTKYQFLFCLSCLFLFIASVLSYFFSKKYVKKQLQDQLTDLKMGKLTNEQTV